jgi:DNA-binding response OmpR family regulator
MRILLMEDDKNIADFIISALKNEHFAIDWVDNAERGLFLGKVNPYDIGIFDIRLAGERSGLMALEEIRAKKKTFPIIILSVTNDTQTKINALNLGADDYLTKPFSVSELLARIRALLRREKTIIQDTLSVADLTMDVRSHKVFRANKEIKLNRKEFSLLEYLIRNSGTVLTRNMILDHVWDMNADMFTNTVDVHIRFLREKIDDNYKKKLLKTVHGCGYKIDEK